MAPIISTLNPLATEFFPSSHISTELRTACMLRQQEQDVDAAHIPVKDLPLEMLSCAVASLGGSAQDLLNCLLANQQLSAAVQTARVTFALTDHQRHVLSNPANVHKLNQLVKALNKYMPGMVSCSLSMLPIEQHHINSLAHGLTHLAALDLSGCKKLQPGVTKLLQQREVLPNLMCVNLQRCFQLTDSCLSDLLEQSCGTSTSSANEGILSVGSSPLQCVALSHLNLANWPNLPHSISTARTSSEAVAFDSQGSNRIQYNNRPHDVTLWKRLQDAVREALLRLPSRLEHTLAMPRSRQTVSSSSSSSSLRVLVLNNCSQLSIEGLLTVATACPHLQFLMLGGSSLKASWGNSSTAAPAAATVGLEQPAAAENEAATPVHAAAYVPPLIAAAAAAGGPANNAILQAQELLPPSLQQLAALLELPEAMHWDALSPCCIQQDGLGCQQRSCSCCSSEGSSSSTRKTQVRKLGHNEPSAAAITLARSHALALAYAIALLPELRAIEVTFLPAGVAGWLRICVQLMQRLADRCSSDRARSMHELLRSCSNSSSGSKADDVTTEVVPLGSQTIAHEFDSSRSVSRSTACSISQPHVWEFSCIASVRQAQQMLQEAKCSGSSAAEAESLHPACLDTAVRCAANCSWNRGRSTPLHLASERGCAQYVSALLSCGAVVAARDRSGASPLFVAAEAGRAAAVEALLQAGADPLVSNTAGETALYIASLRGHLSVVEVLLSYLSASGVDWMQEGLYGDAWTPLMAAAVANRVDVALCLLRAATGFSRTGLLPQQQQGGTEGSSNGTTRYKNHAYAYRKQARHSLDMHKSNSPSNTTCSCAGVERLLAAENRYGQTALHIAARKGCKELLRLLLLYGAAKVAGQVVDAAGDTWTDVARRHGHEVALRELLQQC